MIRLDSKRPRRRLLAAGIVVALALACSLAGCGQANSGLAPETARQLQERVLAVSRSAAANDHPGALKTLADLEAEVTAAADSGQVSEERRRTIMSNITAVRTGLTSAIDAAAAAASAASEAATAAAAQKAAAEAETAAPATQEYTAPVVAAPAPAPAPAPKPEPKKGNEGKGKNKKG
jgi:hypothetical protein